MLNCVTCLILKDSDISSFNTYVFFFPSPKNPGLGIWRAAVAEVRCTGGTGRGASLERGRGLGGSTSAETPAGFPTFPVKTLMVRSHSPRRKGLGNQSPARGLMQTFKACCTAGHHGILSIRLATKEKLCRNIITNPLGLFTQWVKLL